MGIDYAVKFVKYDDDSVIRLDLMVCYSYFHTENRCCCFRIYRIVVVLLVCLVRITETRLAALSFSTSPEVQRSNLLPNGRQI